MRRGVYHFSHKEAQKTQNLFCASCAFCAFCGFKTRRVVPLARDHPCKPSGLELKHWAKLMSVQVFFLNKPYRHHSVLLQTAIEFAAIDTKCGCGSHLVATKLL